MRNTTDSLLKGLPATDYLLAFGQTADPDQARAALKDHDTLFSMGEEIEEIDPEKLKRARALIEEAVPMLTGLRGSIEALPPGPGARRPVRPLRDRGYDGWQESARAEEQVHRVGQGDARRSGREVGGRVDRPAQ